MLESIEKAIVCHKIYGTSIGGVCKSELLEYVKVKNRIK